jgi:uncharacterized protein (DUF2384 family)
MPAEHNTTRYPQASVVTDGIIDVADLDCFEREIRLQAVAARELFDEDLDAACKWIQLPALVLNGRSPLEAAQTEDGMEEALALIDRLADGVLM